MRHVIPRFKRLTSIEYRLRFALVLATLVIAAPWQASAEALLLPGLSNDAQRSGSIRLRPPGQEKSEQAPVAKQPARKTPSALPMPAIKPPLPGAVATATPPTAPRPATIASNYPQPALRPVPDEANGEDNAAEEIEITTAAHRPAPASHTDTGLDDVARVQLIFDGEGDTLSERNRNTLNILSERLRDTGVRMQLTAFAADKEGNSSRARRLALSRSLAVRSFLMVKGIENTRIDVKALGIAQDQGPQDRVDILLTGQ